MSYNKLFHRYTGEERKRRNFREDDEEEKRSVNTQQTPQFNLSAFASSRVNSQSIDVSPNMSNTQIQREGSFGSNKDKKSILS